MHRTKTYYVYIMFGRTGVLYIGMTNNIFRRVREHKSRKNPSFTNRYNVTKLAYYEETSNVWTAIEREKQLKRWRREKKIRLVETMNPKWRDLSKDWFD